MSRFWWQREAPGLSQNLEAHGCELLREGGSHTIYLNPATGAVSAVPRHQEINDILARKICRDLGVPISNRT